MFYARGSAASRSQPAYLRTTRYGASLIRPCCKSRNLYSCLEKTGRLPRCVRYDDPTAILEAGLDRRAPTRSRELKMASACHGLTLPNFGDRSIYGTGERRSDAALGGNPGLTSAGTIHDDLAPA